MLTLNAPQVAADAVRAFAEQGWAEPGAMVLLLKLLSLAILCAVYQGKRRRNHAALRSIEGLSAALSKPSAHLVSPRDSTASGGPTLAARGAARRANRRRVRR